MNHAELTDVTLAYEVRGDGAPVLLVPGGGATRASWDAIAPILVAAGRQVVLFDPRGSGDSTVSDPPYSVEQLAGDVRGLVEHLGHAEVDLVGHSLGGVVAAEFAARYPDRTRRVVFIASPRMSRFNRAWCGWLQTLLTEGGEHAAALLGVPILLSVLGPTMLQNDAIVEAALDSASSAPIPEPRGILGQGAALIEWADSPRSLASVRAPSLVIAFEHDVHAPPGRARAAAAEIPDARYVEIGGQGHGGTSTAPVAVADAIVEFLSVG